MKWPNFRRPYGPLRHRKTSRPANARINTDLDANNGPEGNPLLLKVHSSFGYVFALVKGNGTAET